jgi:Mannosyltransferase (PIG-V)
MRVTNIASWLASPSVRETLTVFVLTRFLFLVLTYFGVILFNDALHTPAHPSFLHRLLPAWDGRWDTAWYIAIAQRGYQWHKGITSPTAFFPLYPVLIRAGVAVTHRSYIVVALGISNVAFLAALGYLYRLSAWEFDDEVARRTILYIATFPTALFFFAGYAESFFLLTTVAAFYHLRRQDWLLAGVFGALASGTRVTGVLLVVPYVYEYARSCNFCWQNVRPRGLGGLALLPCGLLAFMGYLHWKVGDAMAFSHDQAAWQKILTLKLWAGFAESLRQIFIVQAGASFFEAHNIINLALGGIFLALSVQVARRLPLAHTLYLVAFWAVTLSTPAMASGYPVPLISLSRYVLSLFPVFMYLGVLGTNRTMHDGYLVISAGMLAVLTVLFINGSWVI